jgi:hypothetical protein
MFSFMQYNKNITSFSPSFVAFEEAGDDGIIAPPLGCSGSALGHSESPAECNLRSQKNK